MKLAACLVVASVPLTGVARADGAEVGTAPTAPPPPPVMPAYRPVYGPDPGAPPRPQESYGWKILLSDAGAIGLVLATVALSKSSSDDPNSLSISGSDLLVIAGVGWWFTATPLIHLSENNRLGSSLSYGARLALPLAGALLGASLDGSDSEGGRYATGGLVVGALAATAIDALWIAQVPAGSSTPAWIPQFAAGHGGFGLGVVGGF